MMRMSKDYWQTMWLAIGISFAIILLLAGLAVWSS